MTPTAPSPHHATTGLPAPHGWEPRRASHLLSSDVLLSRGLRSALLAAYTGTVYVAVLALGGINYAHLTVSWGLNLIALLIIAATFLPVHSWLQVRINQLVYDWHDDPYAVIRELHQHIDLEQDQTSQAIVPTIAATIAATLRLPYAAIETDLGDGSFTTACGTLLPHTELLTVPLAYRGTPIGALHAAARRPHEPLSASDLRLLHDLARQVGITLHAARLSDALQSSREQLVTAREEERRRIRRDLHDSLGPTLASLRLQLGAVRRAIREEPDGAERLIDELRDDVRAATAEIRRLVYDLRPPLLDEHGLAGALQSLGGVAEQTTLTLEMPTTLPSLSAAVEVALYRIASEAVHNVAKHARATRCTLRLELSEGVVVLTVRDDGVGLPTDHPIGVGMASMHERATELGGTISIATGPDSGTCVSATIPLRSTP